MVQTSPKQDSATTTSVQPRTGAPTTLVEVFEAAAHNHLKPNALNFKQDGRWVPVSSAEMLARIRCLAGGLHAIGVRHGDRVALLSESRVEWTLADAACQFAGAIDVPVYPTLAPPQVRYILEDCGARVLLLNNHEKFLQLQQILKDCHSIEQIVFFDAAGVNAGENDSHGMTLAELEARGRDLAEQQPDLVDTLARQARPEDLATIIYTSGTTGEPKGVMLTHANIVSNVIDAAGHFAFGKDDSALSVLPLSHVFERTAMYMYLHYGMVVYFGESMDRIGANLREVHPTIFIGVPRIFEKIYARVKETSAAKGKLNLALLSWATGVAKEYARCLAGQRAPSFWLRLQHKLASRLVLKHWRKALGGRIRLLISGGAALPEELGYIYLGAGMPIIQGYGLTETSPVITAVTLDDNRVGTVGKPIKHVEIRIAADGEIETRGPNVMRGYYHKPVETSAVFTADGWFKTGDIGTIDKDGFLRITDRKKELFKTSGGKYIAPQPIEQLIKGSRFVNQVVLLGNDRKFPAALIVPDWDQINSYVQLKGIKSRSRAEICQDPRVIDLFVRQIAALTPDLAQFERVKKIALLEKELTIETGELTPTLKVKRRVVDEKYRELIDKLYAEAEGPD